VTDGKQIQIGLVLFPRLTQLDLTGPFEVFARIPGIRVHLAWKRIEPVVGYVASPSCRPPPWLCDSSPGASRQQ
jgi:hypothetical protein